MFRKLYVFPSSGEGRDLFNLMGPLESANQGPVFEVSSLYGIQKSRWLSLHLNTKTDPVSKTFSS
jgi:hypothetical protein